MAQNKAEQINVFGRTNFRNREVAFGIKTDDRRRHMYILGKTGMGKTTMIENMIVQDIQAGNGVAFVDPHGDSVEKILNYIPSSRVNDVVYFNPADIDFPIAFNPLESVDPKYKHLVASGLMGVFTKLWENVWSARMEYILNNTILALLDTPGNTMLGIARMLVDKKFRKRIVDNIRDPVVKSFWVDEFANYNDKFRNEAIAPIQNKVGQFLSSPIIRNVVGQTKSSIDLRDVMDNKKILLLNLSKGRIGEDNSRLLGAMFITKLQLAAMSRVDVLEENRADFYLYVDEFQNFATQSFANILSEARKYRLNLIIAHQYIEQLEDEVRAAVFGNVGSMIIFRIGATDAEALESEFDPVFLPADLVNLTKHHIYLKLMINGMASRPFSAVTLPPIAKLTGNEDKIIKVSRERYGGHKEEIDEKITRWMGQEYHKDAAQQDLVDEDEERGGVIFSGKSDTAESPVVEAQTPVPALPTPVGIPAKAGTPIPRPVPPPKPTLVARPVPPTRIPESGSGRTTQVEAPKPAPVAVQKLEKPKTPDIWKTVAEETQKKNEEIVKKVTSKLVFNFGKKTEPASSVSIPTHPASAPVSPRPISESNLKSDDSGRTVAPEPAKTFEGSLDEPRPSETGGNQPLQPGQKIKF